MDRTSFEDTLFRVLLHVQGLPPAALAHGLGPTEPSGLSEEQLEIWLLARRLTELAYLNGLNGPQDYQIEAKSLAGGAVTEYVWRVTSELRFAFKASENPELAEQAVTLCDLQNAGILTPRLRDLFPRVYSSHVDSPPFAYLMEFFGREYTNLREYLFGKESSPTEATIDRIVQEMFRLFRETVRPTLMPNLHTIYVRRTRERLDEAKRADGHFRTLAESSLLIGSEQFLPYEYYLEEVEATVSQFQPTFSTFVHGDPHPGNIFFKDDHGSVKIKLIDPKSRVWGDYIFDVAKFLHYVLVTGPVEDVEDKPTVRIEDGRVPHIVYDLVPPPIATRVESLTRRQLEGFATEQGDTGFKGRLDLSMAANLLGLCANRLARSLRDNAIIFYCEGLRFLSRLLGT